MSRTFTEFVLPDSTRTVFETAVFKEETIAVGNTVCRKLNAGWTCRERTAEDMVSELDRLQPIIEGRPPSWSSFKEAQTQILESTSYIDTSEDPKCRAYSVSFSWDSKEMGKGKRTETVCFDLKTYNPIFGRSITKQDFMAETQLDEWRFSNLDEPIEIKLPAE